MPPKKVANTRQLRPTLWDDLEEGAENLFCERGSLSNEASVETFFVTRLLKNLGYKDSQIRTKESLDTLAVGRGHRKEKYKPDYALQLKKLTRCIIDAKGTDEELDDWTEQCSGYCLALNRKYPGDENPVRFFILTNGLATKLYRWDSDVPLLVMDFSDFENGNAKYERLKEIVSSENILSSTALGIVDAQPDFSFLRPTSETARHIFASCHNAIRKSGYGPGPAFLEFVKIMFVKLYSDRQLRDNVATRVAISSEESEIKLTAKEVRFSVRWIEEREADGVTNPLDTITFAKLKADIEKNIELRKKKRLFNNGECIDLRPDVVKTVVSKLEHYDMFGIDEDLNGRLFETFLNATMRGKELGQFFTPRSVVKMMSRLADLKATRDHQDKVIDACCGSGGFLIEALTILRNQIRSNSSMSLKEKKDLLDKVCNESIYGIDFGKDPPIARIARINMYLHGDGGSRIYATDGLDKQPQVTQESDPEAAQNIQELRENLAMPVLFDVAMTNPPFSMTKEIKNSTDLNVLRQYKLARKSLQTSELRPSLRSSVMFMERYFDLLKPGGKLITVIDDTLLASNDFVYVRDYIREHFLIRAIISLPGDTFKRSGARVKTSVLMLEKKKDLAELQPSCFAFFSEYLGVDDLTPRASPEDIKDAREKSATETEEILKGYREYMKGKSGPLVLSAARLKDRLDLKHCVPMFGRMVHQWKRKGIEVKSLTSCVKLVEDVVIPRDTPETLYKLIRVTYDGICTLDKERRGRAIKPKTMYRVKAGQIIFSVIRATDGAIGIVPEYLDGALVSDTSYVVFDCPDANDAAYLWAVLRSHELRADMQSLSPGSSRYSTPWPQVGEVKLPWLATGKRRAIGKALIDSWELRRKVDQDMFAAMEKVSALGVESAESIQRWRASKAPQ